jgi:hypothetical protein
MTVRLPTVIKDPRTSQLLNLKKPIEQFETEDDDLFLSGPVGRRVAVLDFDPKDGTLSAPVRFRPPNTEGKKIGGYMVEDVDNVHALDVMKVSVFATVLKTLRLFEGEDTLGRKLTWAFGAPQLLVVPRAGQWTNAYYERDSHSLQFFYFPSVLKPEETVYTALSHDIVAHETGHAILDGIAPDLYNAITPQSLAMHEAIADLTALVMAFKAPNLSKAVLDANGGVIDDSAAFSGIAEQFASERDASGRTLYLRNLKNDKTLNPKGKKENVVARSEPHALSEVLSGALYAVMLKTYKAVWAQQAAKAPGKPKVSSSGKALFIASERFKRMIFRALDYLPPGEASFADYGRAILAADQASYPNDGQERQWITDEFVLRGIVAKSRELRVRTDYKEKALEGIDLPTLVESDWAAYEFANRNRDLLRIPRNVPFRVRPRLDVTKLYYHRGPKTGTVDDEQRVRECLFKVSWDSPEENPLGGAFPPKRNVTVGTSLAIDWVTRKVRVLLSSDLAAEQQADRNEMLRALADQGLLRFGSAAVGLEGLPRPDVIRAESMEGVMRLRGTARMLHILGDLS